MRGNTTRYDLVGDEGPCSAEVVKVDGGYAVTVEGEKYLIALREGAAPGEVVADISGKPSAVTLTDVGMGRVEFVLDGRRFVFRRAARASPVSSPGASEAPTLDGVVAAPMPGKVIGALVKPGEAVRKGDPLVILESMKMEVAVRADRDATVQEVLAIEGTSVKRGQSLVRLAPS